MAIVDVWKVNLDQIPVTASLPLLSAEERDAAGRFGHEVSSRRWMAGRAVLRRILADILHRPADRLAFVTGPAGKPELEGEEAWFNLSHSEHLMLCAVARQRVGVDVEFVRPMGDYPVLARQFFSPAEQEALAGLPVPARELAFFRGWCCKEAYIKGRGDGSFDSLDRFTVEIRPDRPAALLHSDDDGDWHLYDLDLGPGLVAALATEGRAEAVALHHWQPPQ